MFRRIRSSLLLVALPAVPGATGSYAATIEHKAVGCVVAEEHPRFEARLTPADAVGRARVFFRGEGASAWYAVPMTPAGALFAAALPKPTKSLRRFSYYLEVVDASLKSSRTAEYSTNVVVGKGACDKEMMGLSTSAATVLLEAPSGAAAIPAGFSGAGVVAAGEPLAVGSAATASSSGGGGLGAGTLVVGGAVAAAGAAAAVVALGGGEEGIVGTWDGTRTVNNGPLFANCTRVFNEHWIITQTGQDVFADVESIGQSCGTASCGQNCQLFPFPWDMPGTTDGTTARFVVYGGTQCILSLSLSGDRLSGSMSACSESPGMTQDVSLRRTAK